MINLEHARNVYANLSPQELMKRACELGEGTLSDTGALVVDTGVFTGRSPKDRFIVRDAETSESVWWGDINIAISPEHEESLYSDMVAYFEGKDVYVRESTACADPSYRMPLLVVTEHAWQNLFAHDLFMRPHPEEIGAGALAGFVIVSAPGFKATPSKHGTRQENFTIINMSKRRILIGGTAYAGEIKKALFSALNYILPKHHGVLSMHCSANVGDAGDTAIFFGLSGTGKTTLSADPKRSLIGDDEHGWGATTVFNFEGGCYAKCVNLKKEKEPEIYAAIKDGAVLENVKFIPGTTTPDYTNISKTENTRVAYPLTSISNARVPSVGSTPKNIFFLTCDAYGVLPPISKLETEQAMQYFLLGYTAKVAGTEVGITEPQATFSACFGKAFLPLNPKAYAHLLGAKLKLFPNIQVWLINTGWSGGPYGKAERIALSHTRALVDAALSGELNTVAYETLPIFNLRIPKTCPNVPTEILNPRTLWADTDAYDTKAKEIFDLFTKNFEEYK